MTEPVQLPEPLVPAEVDLSDFDYTPVFRQRLFNSTFHARASDAEWRAGFTLWLKSWDQHPSGTLPDDDIDLCRLAELARDFKAWRKVKAMALHGWFKCSDGRLHHEVVAEVVLAAWEKRASASKKGKAGATKRWGKRHPPATQKDSPGNSPSIGQLMPNDSNRSGSGSGSEEVQKPKALSGSPPDPAPDAKKKTNGAAFSQDAEAVLNYLNRQTGKAFEFRNRSGGLTSNAERVIARLKQGYTAEELREVIHAKCVQWKRDDKMAEYLRPATLFARENFEQYLGELGRKA